MTNITLHKVGDILPINQELAGLVPMASEAEQAALTQDIKVNGLREPIVLWKGKVIDGRCRQKSCEIAGKPLMSRELPDHVTEAEARIFVKSVNTRRNLTHTQKVISACKESMRPESDSVLKIAKAWGIGKAILNNARYIYREANHLIEPLFNGEAVAIVGANGKATTTSKVSAVYASVKRHKEAVTPVEPHGWMEDSYITTQAGKDWYYSIVSNVEDTRARMALADYANILYACTDIQALTSTIEVPKPIDIKEVI